MDLQLLSRAEAPSIDIDAWRELCERAVVANPFYEPWALLPALRFLEPCSDVRVVLVYVDGTLSGLFPVKRTSGRFGIRYLSTWKYPDCYLTDPLLFPGLDLDEIFRQTMERFDVCCFMSPSHTASTLLKSRNAVFTVRERGAITESISWDQYQALQPRKVRKENRRVISRVLGVPEMRYLVAGQGLAEEWFPRFLRLEAAGWKGEGGWAVQQDENRTKFLFELMRRGEAEGKIEFQALIAGNEVFAIAFRYVTRRCSFEVKTTFSEKHSRLYPGVVLELLNMKDLLEKGLAMGDSCATHHNELVNRIWPGRRRVYKSVEFSDTIGGQGRRAAYRLYRRLVETLGNSRTAGKVMLVRNDSE